MASPALLTHKVAAITGGVTGIGRAIVLDYLRHGAKVGVNHLGDAGSQEHFGTLVAEAQAAGVPQENVLEVVGDISQPETARRLVEETVGKFGRLDVFVSNAGVCRFAEFLE